MWKILKGLLWIRKNSPLRITFCQRHTIMTPTFLQVEIFLIQRISTSHILTFSPKQLKRLGHPGWPGFFCGRFPPVIVIAISGVPIPASFGVFRCCPNAAACDFLRLFHIKRFIHRKIRFIKSLQLLCSFQTSIIWFIQTFSPSNLQSFPPRCQAIVCSVPHLRPMPVRGVQQLTTPQRLCPGACGHSRRRIWAFIPGEVRIPSNNWFPP